MTLDDWIAAAHYVDLHGHRIAYWTSGDGRPLLLGERVSVADCTLQASLQFVRYVEADVFGERPLVRAWDERYRQRPAAQQVLRW